MKEVGHEGPENWVLEKNARDAPAGCQRGEQEGL